MCAKRWTGMGKQIAARELGPAPRSAAASQHLEHGGQVRGAPYTHRSAVYARKVSESFPTEPVKAWTDPDTWARRLSPEGCPFCVVEPFGAYVELPASRAWIPDVAVLPGYVLVVSKVHAIEPYELPATDRTQFWEDAMRTAAAVASVVEPVKMNYEIHGNTVPHLHMHIFPRFVGDPFERSPIDPHAVTPTRRSPAEVEALRVAISEGHAAVLSG
jgi:diadenosine tetraphosphate (Ap4A) HIT family hydrolase